MGYPGGGWVDLAEVVADGERDAEVDLARGTLALETYDTRRAAAGRFTATWSSAPS